MDKKPATKVFAVVTTSVVHTTYRVEAASLNEAIEEVLEQGGGEECSINYEQEEELCEAYELKGAESGPQEPL